MTPLESIIRASIAQNGPMAFDTYMALCLYHPQHGYYMCRDPFGQAGDFITAPEISQLFGECIALWAIETWQKLGQPHKFILLECGAGRGTLMADLLRAARVEPAFLQAAQITILEISPYLQKLQQERLKDYHSVLSTNIPAIEWISDVSQIPSQPIIMIANEFLDAFPVKRFVESHNGPQEQHIIVRDNHLVFDCGGTCFEQTAAAQDWVKTFCTTLAAQKGAGLFIDYAYDNPHPADTTQALYRHRHAHLLENCGMQDLTAHVNFYPLREIATAQKLKTEIRTQAEFLQRYGIAYRLAQLLQKATTEQAQTLQSGAARLLDKQDMGSLFKTLILSNLP